MSIETNPALINQAHGAYLKLERMIVTLELNPGAMYSEAELIDKAQMGRTPVREAVQRLEIDGFMLVRPRMGIQIAEIKASNFLKVLELRRVLEPILADAATRSATAEHRSKISTCHDMMTESVSTLNIKLYLDADKMFDRLLVDAAKNPFLEKILGPLQTHARRFWYHYIGTAELANSAALHMPVMDAFKRQDPEQAKDMMRVLVEKMIAKATAGALD